MTSAVFADCIRAEKKTIGVNGILRFFNVCVVCAILSGFLNEELQDNPYVDWLTLTLGMVLCVQTHIALRQEQRYPNPFVLLMAYQLIFFYSLRIFTLLIHPVQDVFQRYADYQPSDSNFALLYIILANTALYAGFYCVKLPAFDRIPICSKPLEPRVGVVLLAVSILASLFPALLGESPSSPVIFVFENFLTPNNVLLVLAAYVIHCYGGLSRYYLIVVIVGAAFLLTTQTAGASRSGLLTLAEYTMVLMLACRPRIRVSMKGLLFGMLTLPLLFAAAISLYSVATETRMNRGETAAGFTAKFETLSRSWDSVADTEQPTSYIPKALSRAGYLDYSAEIIAHASRYEDLFSAANYTKSIVDNLLTPGFDLFDQPKISNCLKYSYGNLGSCSKKDEMIPSRYHTDQFGVYGEMYAVFGYGSLIVLFLTSIVFKKALSCTQGSRSHVALINRMLLLLIFLRLLSSFGLDWILIFSVVTFVSFHAILRLSLLQAARLDC